MADNKNIRDGRDKAKINSRSASELDYAAKQWGTTRDKIKEAIAAVGTSRKDVEEFLRTRFNPAT